MYSIDTSAMSPEETVIANQFMNVFNRRDESLKSELRKDLVGIESEISKLKQIGAMRPVGGGNGHTDTGAPQMMRHKDLHTWLASPRSKNSSHAISVAYDISRKAAGVPITGTGGTVHAGGIAGTPQPQLRLAELFTVVQMTSGSAAEYTEESKFMPGAAVVAEGALKPETDLEFTNKLATVQTIATVKRVSLQSLVDTPSLEQWIDMRLSYSVQLKAEELFLTPLMTAAGAITPGYTRGLAQRRWT